MKMVGLLCSFRWGRYYCAATTNKQILCGTVLWAGLLLTIRHMTYCYRHFISIKLIGLYYKMYINNIGDVVRKHCTLINILTNTRNAEVFSYVCCLSMQNSKAYQYSLWHIVLRSADGWMHCRI